MTSGRAGSRKFTRPLGYSSSRPRLGNALPCPASNRSALKSPRRASPTGNTIEALLLPERSANGYHRDDGLTLMIGLCLFQKVPQRDTMGAWQTKTRCLQELASEYRPLPCQKISPRWWKRLRQLMQAGSANRTRIRYVAALSHRESISRTSEAGL